MYRQKGEWDKAKLDLDQAIEPNLNDAFALARRGEMYRQKGEWDEAELDLNSSDRADFNDAFALARRGEVYRQKGEWDKAKQDLDQAIGLNSNDAFASRTSWDNVLYGRQTSGTWSLEFQRLSWVIAAR